MNPGQQLAAMRPVVFKQCDCGTMFTCLASRESDKCQKCRRKAVNATAYRRRKDEN